MGPAWTFRGLNGAWRGREASSLPPVKISREHHDALIAHAREEAPNECCGYIELSGRPRRGASFAPRTTAGFAVRLRRSTGRRTCALYKIEDEAGASASTTRTRIALPEPSQQDINLARVSGLDLMVIISLAGEPEVRAWRIADGRVEEESIELA